MQGKERRAHGKDTCAIIQIQALLAERFFRLWVIELYHKGFGTPLAPRDSRSDPPGLRSHEPSGSQISRGWTPAFMRRRPRLVARCFVHVSLGDHLQPCPTSFLSPLSTQHSFLVAHLGAKGACTEEREISDAKRRRLLSRDAQTFAWATILDFRIDTFLIAVRYFLTCSKPLGYALGISVPRCGELESGCETWSLASIYSEKGDAGP